MIVEIIKANESQNFPKIGEYYKAKVYQYDSDKVTLIYQVDENTGDKMGEQHCECSDIDPLCNEYRNNIRIV